MWKFNKDNWVYIAEPNIEMFLLEQHNNQLGDEKLVIANPDKPKNRPKEEQPFELIEKSRNKRSKKVKAAIQT